MTRNSFYVVADVPVLELLLDPENARIRAGADQADCIEKILRKEDQVIALLRDIAEHGLSTVPILISKNDEQKWVVRDGNRRVTALKLLNNPELAPNDRVKALVRGIVEKHRASIPAAIDCMACDDEAAMLQELLVRHAGVLNGVGQVTWSTYLRVAFLLQHGQPDQNKRAAQYLRWAEEHGLPVDDEFPITTLTRMLNAEALKQLGFAVLKDSLIPRLPAEQVRRMANRIIIDLQSGEVKVNDLFTEVSQKAYLARVRAEAGVSEPEAAPAAGGGAPQGATGRGNPDAKGPNAGASPGGGAPNGGAAGGGASGQANPGPRSPSPAKPSWDRSGLFPRNKPGISVAEQHVKVRNIIAELRSLKVSETPIAVAVLFRSLLDVSEAYYRQKHGLPDKQAFHRNIAAVADHMKARGNLTEDRHNVIVQRSREDSGILHVKSLHGYVHSESFHPQKQVLNSLWDEIGVFVTQCWYEPGQP